MKIKPVYIQVPGSKYTTIQLEMPGRTTVNDINMFLCSSFCDNGQPIQNPHIAAYYAYVIQQMRVGVQGLKNKKDIPVQLNYGVYDNIVIVSASFISDNSFLRLMSKMLAEKCFLKNLKPAVHMLNSVFKDYVREKGREDIEESMRWCQKSVNVMVMSKMDSQKFEGNEDSIGHKAVTLKFNALQDAVEFTKTIPIESNHIKIDPDVYAGLDNKEMTNDVFLPLILSSLNGQRVPYHYNLSDIHFVKRQMNAQHKEQTIKYIKERLGFTSKKKEKTFSSLSADAKKKTSESEFNKKQKMNIVKKQMALLQVVTQTAAVPHKQLLALENKLDVINIDKLTKTLSDLKDQLDMVVKFK